MSGAPATRPHLDSTQRSDWLRLMRSENVGPVTFRLLLNRYGSAQSALDALPELSARGGLPRRVTVATREEADRELEAVAKLGARMVAPGETGYPPLLAQTDASPPLLAVMGDYDAAHHPCIGIVGSRNASAAGLKIARMFASELAEAGCTVVSGLARGIDAAAHEASLDRGTIAVLAGGLANIYPQQNRPLAANIIGAGLLISEMPVSHGPRAQDFPRRNRIISGCCHAIIVVEAAKRSGSLITARLAAEQNRDVFAVPGSILDPRADGTNALIRKGATLVTAASQVIEAIEPQLDRWERQPGQQLTLDEVAIAMPEAPEDPELGTRIIRLLSAAPIDFDTLCREARAPAGQTAGAILELELAGRIMRHPGNRLSRND
ncbi:MAG: DNA-processing protein DprA [Pseudomonadota bacterium]